MLITLFPRLTFKLPYWVFHMVLMIIKNGLKTILNAKMSHPNMISQYHLKVWMKILKLNYSTIKWKSLKPRLLMMHLLIVLLGLRIIMVEIKILYLICFQTLLNMIRTKKQEKLLINIHPHSRLKFLIIPSMISLNLMHMIWIIMKLTFMIMLKISREVKRNLLFNLTEFGSPRVCLDVVGRLYQADSKNLTRWNLHL